MILKHPVGVLIALAVAFSACGAAATRLKVDTTYVGFLPDDGQTRRDLAEITRNLAGVVPLYVTIDTGTDGGGIEPDVLARVAALQRYLETLPHVSRTLSVVDFLSELNRALQGGAAGAAAALPMSRALAANLLLLYESNRYGADLGRFLTSDHRRLNVWVRTDLQSSEDTTQLVETIRHHLRAHFPAFDCHVTGTLYTVFRSANDLAWSQVHSLALALASIGPIVMTTVGSVRYGLLALPTNLLPLVLLFGAMGAFGVPLSMPTSVVAAFTLGVLVDDSVHFLIRYREALAQGLGWEAAIERVFGVIGRAILFNAAALSVAFLVLTTSSFRPIAQAGWLTAGTLLAGVTSDLLLLPLLLRGASNRRIGAAVSPQMAAFRFQGDDRDGAGQVTR